jgi:thiamine biosynthesis lipoprotein
MQRSTQTAQRSPGLPIVYRPSPYRTLLIVGLLALLTACGPHKEIHRIQGQVFGTAVEISIYGESPERARVLGALVLNEFNRLHHKFHAWQPSELTALNDHIARGERYQGDAEMVYLLKSATALAERSGNTFNPAIGHLIRLWGFQSDRATAHEPAPADIKRWVDANPRMTDLHYDGTVIWSTNNALMLDFGGWVKGYALDQAARILRDEGVEAALINVGGNILAIGQPGERPWRVGIQDPRHEGTVAQLDLHDGEAIGTSGDYRRYFMQEGKRRAHIIDPRSGETVDLVASVTIITAGGDDVGLRSDGYSKPLFIVGPAHWRDMAQQLGLSDVMLIDIEGNAHMTPSMQVRMNAQPAAQ